MVRVTAGMCSGGHLAMSSRKKPRAINHIEDCIKR